MWWGIRHKQTTLECKRVVYMEHISLYEDIEEYRRVVESVVFRWIYVWELHKEISYIVNNEVVGWKSDDDLDKSWSVVWGIVWGELDE